MKRYVHLLSYLCLAFACGLALAQVPKDDDDAYAVNRNIYKKSAEAADLNKTLNIKVAMAKLLWPVDLGVLKSPANDPKFRRSEEHTSELQSRFDLVCRLLLEKKKKHDH